MDDTGVVHWVLPDGTERHAPPKNFGVIGNGHFIKLASKPGETTVWDTNFESVFQQADQNFPFVIEQLQGFAFDDRRGFSRRERFVHQDCSDEFFSQLVEGIVSLAVRSPKTREAAVSLAEKLRGPLPERERNSLIGANLRHMHDEAVKQFGARGIAVVIQSAKNEFIYGDGFYHNLTSPANPPNLPRILVPITPEIAVLYAIPLQYSPQKRLSTLVIDQAETKSLNDVLQIYARQALFYRSEKPTVINEFNGGEHLRFANSNNLVEEIVCDAPGVAPMNTQLVDLQPHTKQTDPSVKPASLLSDLVKRIPRLRR
ncbi:hypothetical protein [Shimia biformata]|uniref:hypothetical protein n=1 Tax=Shimia biformata TaxID=1294299 RepID=UPI001951EA89